MSGRGVRRSLTGFEYDQILPLMKNISVERREAARLALVDGLGYEEIAGIYGWSRQAVATAVNRAWEAFQTVQEIHNVGHESHLPDGWVRVTLVAPEVVVPDLRSTIARHVRMQELKKKMGTTD